MSETYIATATTTIDASPETVWAALTTPDLIEQYYFGAEVITDWEEGNPIVFKGEWEDESYEDKGTILEFKPDERLVYTHWSPLSGDPDVPENYHTITCELSQQPDGTDLTLTQDNNDTKDARDHSQQNWQMMLENLKKLLEG
jgi:uncharacterized protein YndB with AHSA1/START domain